MPRKKSQKLNKETIAKQAEQKHLNKRSAKEEYQEQTLALHKEKPTNKKSIKAENKKQAIALHEEKQIKQMPTAPTKDHKQNKSSITIQKYLNTPEAQMKLQILQHYNIDVHQVLSITKNAGAYTEGYFSGLFNKLFILDAENHYVSSYHLRALLSVFTFKDISAMLREAKKNAPIHVQTLTDALFMRYKDDANEEIAVPHGWLTLIQKKLGAPIIAEILAKSQNNLKGALIDLRDSFTCKTKDGGYQLQGWAKKMLSVICIEGTIVNNTLYDLMLFLGFKSLHCMLGVGPRDKLIPEIKNLRNMLAKENGDLNDIMQQLIDTKQSLIKSSHKKTPDLSTAYNRFLEKLAQDESLQELKETETIPQETKIAQEIQTYKAESEMQTHILGLSHQAEEQLEA
jgi:hypothetical protein